MKTEFKKINFTKKDFSLICNSVKFEGTFCRMSSDLIKVESIFQGNLELTCDRCAQTEEIYLDEKLDFLLSDGPYTKDSSEMIMETKDGIIDFNEIVDSEISSIRSDYFICSECEKNRKSIEQEF